ncbi:thioredoxin-like 3-2, chloroplastic [Phoenix dactylifera]|uniref:Thioredoxin-like 3-2, chloroplastic n=1 Tax=Phoenix dactylifera TaxID=42345 RepID=A0A8B7CJF4_PHODC|nr:thioredoxin-like 3-2, chloroplastic [Phoenix dactylifera]
MTESLLLSSSPSTAASRSLWPSSSPCCPSPRSVLLRLPRRRHLETTSRPLSSASIAGSSRSPTSRLSTPIFVSAAAAAWSGVEEVPPPEDRLDDGGDGPSLIELVPILSEAQFDRVIAEAQQLEESVIVLWMANWCRKCIYLKPKLEKMAADYFPRIRFYCVDVNAVPQRLVTRAEIAKMPTIQLWKDSKKQAEVIGGHKAWLVVDDVRRMIENED